MFLDLLWEVGDCKTSEQCEKVHDEAEEKMKKIRLEIDKSEEKEKYFSDKEEACYGLLKAVAPTVLLAACFSSLIQLIFNHSLKIEGIFILFGFALVICAICLYYNIRSIRTINKSLELLNMSQCYNTIAYLATCRKLDLSKLEVVKRELSNKKLDLNGLRDDLLKFVSMDNN